MTTGYGIGVKVDMAAGYDSFGVTDRGNETPMLET